MSISIQNQMDPIYETILLLYLGYDVDKFKSTLVSQINEAGGDGEGVYHKYLAVNEKYVRAFQKNRITSDRDSFYFKDTSFDFFNSFISPFLADKDLINSIGQMNNNQIMKILFLNSEDIFERKLPDYSEKAFQEFIKVENIIKFVNSFDSNENEKWKMFLILQNPQDYYNYFADLVLKNISAYKKSVEVIKPSLDKYLEQFNKAITSEEKAKKFLADSNFENCEITQIIPSMATASGFVITSGQSCYYGLLAAKVMTEIGLKGSGKEYLITCLKALSDHSKLEILTSLKVNPKYATELAAQLGLTSATVSYHMGTLLATRMVYVEKENGKYYYHVDKDSLKEIIEQLRQLLM